LDEALIEKQMKEPVEKERRLGKGGGGERHCLIEGLSCFNKQLDVSLLFSLYFLFSHLFRSGAFKIEVQTPQKFLWMGQ
jgi:hypothetical protein